MTAEPADFAVGQSSERTFAITDAAVRAFAAVSGDDNPVHLDEDYAAKTAFRGRIAHGMLLGAHVSAVLGTQLPGPGGIYLSQTLEFLEPVRIGAEVLVRVEIVDMENRLLTLATTCTVDGVAVARGHATVRPPRRRKGSA